MRANMGLSVFVGLVIGGVIGVVLTIKEVPAGDAIGTFVGGLVAALLLYAERRRALIGGFLVGIFGFPIQLLILLALISAHLYAPEVSPEVAEMSQEALLAALAVNLLLQIAGGIVGGLLGSLIRHPPQGTVEAPPPYLPPPPSRPEKYCIQCGAGLAKETLICPACGAKQPS
jgi:hypothetical protein